MGRTETEDRRATNERRNQPCRRELLQRALSGRDPEDQQLEKMLDHLERTR